MSFANSVVGCRCNNSNSSSTFGFVVEQEAKSPKIVNRLKRFFMFSSLSFYYADFLILEQTIIVEMLVI
jgi:hypothetical protein